VSVRVEGAGRNREVSPRVLFGARGDLSGARAEATLKEGGSWGKHGFPQRDRAEAEGGGSVSRHDGRRADELRPLEVVPDFLEQPHGSVLFSQGKTRVLCTASVQDGVPRWLYGKGRGWLTAEYSLLPASTGDRTEREASRGRQGGRTIEIQRLIGRSIRSVTDFDALGERTLWVDCDVLQADGGTRCAAITGAYVAARRALDRFGLSKALTGSVAAVSVGIVDDEALLDLDYAEDSQADVDMNVVMSGEGALVEVQATAERMPFTRARLDELLELAAGGIEELAEAQSDAVAATRV
jgi:ribonuclease PH